MPLDPQALWNVAEKLYKNSISEESDRSCANRAYYAAFHQCSRIASKYSIKPTGKNNTYQHTQIADELIKNKNSHMIQKDLRKLGYMLKQTRCLRVKADYRDIILFSRNQAKDTLLAVKKILLICQKL